MGSIEFTCKCGRLFLNSTDNRSYVAQYITDQNYDDFSDVIDDAIEKSGESKQEKESACMEWRKFAMPHIWQCHICSSLYVKDYKGNRYHFTPSEVETPKDLFKKEFPG
jgi:hypothetical protein